MYLEIKLDYQKDIIIKKKKKKVNQIDEDSYDLFYKLIQKFQITIN